MAEKAIFDVLSLQGLFQEGVVLKIDHAKRHVSAGAPVGVYLAQFVSTQRFS